MDIERLEELKKEVAESNLKVTGVGYLTDLQDLINAEIARQSVTSEEVTEAISHIQGGYGDIWHWPKKRRDTIITALQAYKPWIPVSERLPKNCESYLVVVREEDQPNDLIHVDVASSYGKYIDDFWDTFNDWKEGQEVHITHWKPLPEPPKGE